MILLHFCVCFCIATAHPIRNTLPLFSNRKCKSKTDKNTLVAANAWGNSRSDLSWDKEALPDLRVSIGQKTKFPVWPMRPAREQHAVLAAGRVPAQIFVGESYPRHLLVR